MQVRVERAALAMAKDRASDLAARHVALVDSTAVLMTREGFQFPQGLGDGGLMGGDEPGVAADERLDRHRLGRRGGRSTGLRLSCPASNSTPAGDIRRGRD